MLLMMVMNGLMMVVVVGGGRRCGAPAGDGEGLASSFCRNGLQMVQAYRQLS